MRNRAKCKLCQEIIESFHRLDDVTCKCGEISITGGNDYLGTAANDYNNFMRVDDEGNEIMVKVEEKSGYKEDSTKDILSINEEKKTKKEQGIEMLQFMIKDIERLPPNAMISRQANRYSCTS